jgi:hypothetical protein
MIRMKSESVARRIRELNKNTDFADDYPEMKKAPTREGRSFWGKTLKRFYGRGAFPERTPTPAFGRGAFPERTPTPAFGRGAFPERTPTPALGRGAFPERTPTPALEPPLSAKEIPALTSPARAITTITDLTFFHEITLFGRFDITYLLVMIF